MPIYAYRCAECGHTKDVLQKLSDPVLTTCPSCGKESFSKQLTAAGFQLKGSGWYVTDFRGGNNSGGAKPSGDAPAGEAKSEPAKPESSSKGDTAASASSGTDSSGGGGCGSACACH